MLVKREADEEEQTNIRRSKNKRNQEFKRDAARPLGAVAPREEVTMG
jgi:hypothetical protein